MVTEERRVDMAISKTLLLVGLVSCLFFIETSAESSLCQKSTIATDGKDLSTDEQELLSAVKNDNHETVLILANKGVNIASKTNLGDTLLHLAVICESIQVTDTLIKLGLNPNKKNEKGITPIWRALDVGNITIMDVLKENGAKIDTKSGPFNDTLLHAACRIGNDQVVSWLLDYGMDLETRNDLKETPLLIATVKGHQILVHMLISNGANVNCKYKLGESPLHAAASYGHLAVVQTLIKHGAKVNSVSLTGLTPLHRASEAGHDLVIQELIANGAKTDESSMNSFGLAPLHMAVFNLNSVKILLDNGADINITTFNGAKPIHWVGYGTSLDQSEVVQLLIDNGADIYGVMSNGWTPLHHAALHGSSKIVQKFVETGAEINTQDGYGRTPMHYVTIRNDPNLVQFLIENGANLTIQDIDGETPISWAKNRGLNNIVDILIDQTNYFLSM